MTAVKNRKPKAVIDPPGEPIKSPQWKCVAFTKNGKSYRSQDTYNSLEESDRAGIDGAEAIRISLFMGEDRTLTSMDGKFKFSEYSYFISMPWTKE